MFLKQVYRYNKWLFGAFAFFVAGQLFINYKRGLICTPFFHYGMYSHVIPVEKKYTVWEIWVNGKILRGSNFAPHVWDKILLPLNYYSDLKKSNSLYTNEIKRIFAKINLAPKQEYFIQQCNNQSFYKWYSVYLSDIIDKKINTCTIIQRTYLFDDSKLKPTNSIIPFTQKCN